MEYQMEELRDEESEMLKLFGFRPESTNTQASYSNHSQHNSSGSNPESVYYY